MPFVANTPESLLARSDSKNPSSTCRGITSAGRACRRAVTPSVRKRLDPSDETLYCWQHREQASHSARSSPGPALRPIRENEKRTSLDTLADRMGLVDLDEKKHRSRPRPPKQRYPHGFNDKDRKRSTLQLCCFSVPIDEVPEKPRPRPVAALQERRTVSAPAPYTATLKKLIPNSVDAATASALMAELARPVTESDEPGYIYMFWLTYDSPSARKTAPPVAAARSMLDADDDDDDAASVSNYAGSKSLLLKIGRAANVQRRMNQWQRQCGHDVQVLRYYPLPAAPPVQQPVVALATVQTPHVKKVERLVHLELSGMGLKADLGVCEACGREHREWFEVRAKRDAIRKVDKVIRKWIDWDLRNNTA